MNFSIDEPEKRAIRGARGESEHGQGLGDEITETALLRAPSAKFW